MNKSGQTGRCDDPSRLELVGALLKCVRNAWEPGTEVGRSKGGERHVACRWRCLMPKESLKGIPVSPNEGDIHHQSRSSIDGACEGHSTRSHALSRFATSQVEPQNICERDVCFESRQHAFFNISSRQWRDARAYKYLCASHATLCSLCHRNPRFALRLLWQIWLDLALGSCQGPWPDHHSLGQRCSGTLSTALWRGYARDWQTRKGFRSSRASGFV